MVLDRFKEASNNNAFLGCKQWFQDEAGQEGAILQ
jgi:hypothetical protein